MSDHDNGHIEEHIKVYLTVFGALAFLTLLTVAIDSAKKMASVVEISM